MWLISECFYMRPNIATYDQLCETALGFTGRLIGSINIVMLEILVGAGYIVFVGRNFASVVFGVPAEGLMLACLPIIGAFLFQKDVNSLGFISGAGNAAIVCSLAIIMYFSFMNTEGNGTYHYGGDLEGLAVFMGSTVFMFSGHAEVVAIVKPMKDRSKYPKVLVISVGTLFLIYLVFGLVVYISFGEKTEGLIFENMSGNLVAVTKVFHSLAILFSIPVKLWPAFEAIELGMLGQNWEIQPNVTLQTRITSVGIRLSLLIATGAVAILVPDFAFLVAFCGSFCITLVGLVLPPLMYIILCNADSNQFREDRRMSTLSCVIHWILFAIGVGVCVGSSAQILIAKFSK
mmetsp:Transcript_34228/g.57947  ORF Transcript_34228/g.57947 Transcript_34228/m.57947 type:complete len:347 (+) Transcript_34228:387-1427(+)